MEFSDPVVKHEVFQKVLVGVQKQLTELELHGLANNLKAQQWADILSRGITAEFRTWALGGNVQTIYFEGEAEFSCPATWWDHLKESTHSWALVRGHIRLADWLEPRVNFTSYRKRVTDQRDVATHVCPHIAIATNGDQVHFDFLRGEG